jgi:hypothetical protein
MHTILCRFASILLPAQAAQYFGCSFSYMDPNAFLSQKLCHGSIRYIFHTTEKSLIFENFLYFHETLHGSTGAFTALLFKYHQQYPVLP